MTVAEAVELRDALTALTKSDVPPPPKKAES